MDFFERQRSVRTSSTKLVLLYILAVVMIVLVIDTVVYVAFAARGGSDGAIGMALVATVVSLLVIGLTSAFQIVKLSRGGGVKVAESLGAVPLENLPDTPALRRYRNVVEEISIASSTPVPRLFVMTEERGINAFAAGATTGDAAVAVTQGTLDRLNRDELQGVIAHEFSHIVNGDMRLSIRLIGVLAGITALAVVGRLLMHGGGLRGRGNGGGGFALAVLAFGLTSLVVGYVGVFFARMIKASVSRQREYLADASAVQYTRQTAGLAGALKKIGGLDAGSKLKSSRAETVSHMLFGEGLRMSGWLATHPPLVDRIAVLEPGFTADQLEHLERGWTSAPPDGMAEDRTLGLTGPGEAPSRAARSPRNRGHEGDLAGRVGTPTESSFDVGGQLLERLPANLTDAAHRPDLALGLVYALLLDRSPAVRNRQLGIIGEAHGRVMVDHAQAASAHTDLLAPDLRLPLVEVAFPALRQRSSEELGTVTHVVERLIAADGQASGFEYCLGVLVRVGLHEARTHRPPWRTRRTRLRSVGPSVATMLSVLAWAGSPDPATAARAFHAGWQHVGPEQGASYVPPSDGVHALERTWADLDGLEGAEKAALVNAIGATVLADRVVSLPEVELTRTICGVLHCPVPPMG